MCIENRGTRYILKKIYFLILFLLFSINYNNVRTYQETYYMKSLSIMYIVYVYYMNAHIGKFKEVGANIHILSTSKSKTIII